MGANPHTNGGILLRDLVMPNFQDYAVEVTAPGAVQAEDARVLGRFLRDVITCNEPQRNFRIFGPDETVSNRLGAVFEVTNRQWDADTVTGDDHLAPTGRVDCSRTTEGVSPWAHTLDAAHRASAMPGLNGRLLILFLLTDRR